MKSLVGIEGLLYNCKVHCYGIPFYAGWGLTIDKHLSARRTKKRTLVELIAATYILYPRYINWQTEAFTTPEYILTSLHAELLVTKKTSVSNHSLMRKLTKLVNIAYGLLRIAKRILVTTFKPH
jgi:capsular polysaccharide export protein